MPLLVTAGSTGESQRSTNYQPTICRSVGRVPIPKGKPGCWLHRSKQYLYCCCSFLTHGDGRLWLVLGGPITLDYFCQLVTGIAPVRLLGLVNSWPVPLRPAASEKECLLRRGTLKSIGRCCAPMARSTQPDVIGST